MKKYLYIYIALLIFTISKSQNLVPNNSFETFTICPNNGGQIESAIPWGAATTNSSTDYYNACSSSAPVPNYPGGYQIAKTGNAYAGIFLMQYPFSNIREYLQVKLLSPLIQNATYYVEFYVNLRDGSSTYSSCNNISANFSITQPFTATVGTLQSLTAHILNFGNPIIGNDTTWSKVSGCYTAQGGEEYLTIGNFMDDSNTQILVPNKSSYYFVDDVLVEEITGTCVTGINELSTIFNFDVYPNPTIDNLKITISNLNNKEKLSVKIIDVIGKEILNEPYQEELDISRLEQGIYFVSVYSNNQLLGTKKVVKE